MSHDEYILERDKTNLYGLFKKCEELKLPIKITYDTDLLLWHVECNIHGEAYVANGDLRCIAENILEQL